MNQHTQLNPDYGPDPWGARLKGLDGQIPQLDALPESESVSEQATPEEPQS